MATKSIIKDVEIKTEDSCRKLLSSLENAKEKRSINVAYSQSVENIEGERIKGLFEERVLVSHGFT